MTMKKIAVIALSLSLASSAAFAQGGSPPGPGPGPAPGLADSNGVIGISDAPGIVIAGGLGTSGIVLGALGLLLLAGLGGSDNTNSNVSSNTTTD